MDNIVHDYVDACLASLKTSNLMRLPDPHMPAEMRDPTFPPDRDWVAWKPIASTVTDEELDSLQGEFHIQFPANYRGLLKYKHYLGLAGPVRFFRHPVGCWRQIVSEYYRGSWGPHKTLEAGLVPFGDETFMDAGPVCFDVRSGLIDGDCPVVFWDHEWIGTEREIAPMFSSSLSMFRCLLFSVQHGMNFFYHDDDDDVRLLPDKRKLLSQFLALDPTGAGGKAREYWTCWGVEP